MLNSFLNENPEILNCTQYIDEQLLRNKLEDECNGKNSCEVDI